MPLAPIAHHPTGPDEPHTGPTMTDYTKPPKVMVAFSCGRRDGTDDPNDCVDLTARPPRRESGPTFGPFEYAELTYETLRYGPNGDTLAFWDASVGDWRLAADAGPYAGETYSDAVIYPIGG